MKPLFLRFVLVVTAAAFASCSAESKRVRLLDRAATHYRANDFEKARIDYQNVLQMSPDDVTANERLGLIWFERGATMRALAYLSKMNRLAPGNLDLRLKRAQLILSLGQVAEARKEALAILERSSSVSEALVLLTETIRDQDDLKAGEQFLKNFREKNTVSFHLASANIFIFRGDTARAKVALQHALVLDPKSGAAHSAMAVLHVAQNNLSEAAVEHKRAVELSPVRSSIRLKRATFLAQNGAMPEAIASLIDMTVKAPDYLPGWRALAQLALLEERPDDALAYLQSVLTREAGDYEAHILRARVWLAQGDAEHAIRDLWRLGESYPRLGVEKYYLALAYLQNNDQSKALITLEQAVSQLPDNIEAILLQAQLNLQSGAPLAAATAMADLITKRPHLMPAYLLLIEASRALGKLEELHQALDLNLTKSPKNGLLHYVLGLTYARLEQPAEARQSFNKALEVSPDFPPPVIELVEMDLKEGRLTSAMHRTQAVLEKNPKQAWAHFLTCKIHSTQYNWHEAELAAIKTINLDAKHSGAYGLLATAFSARKNQPGMREKLAGFLEKRSDDRLAVLLGSHVYTQMKAFDQVRDLTERYLTAKPTDTVVMTALAKVYFQHFNQPDRALGLLRKARELEPSSPAIAGTLGWILYQGNDFQEALPLLQESAKKLPENHEAQFHLGMVNRMLGHNDAALTAFRNAAKGSGNFSGKKEAIRQMMQLEKAAVTLTDPLAETVKKE